MDLDLFLFTKGATFEFAQNRYFFGAFYSEFHLPFPANKPNNCRQDKTNPSYDLFSLNSQPGTRPRIGGKRRKKIGERREPRGSLGREKCGTYLTPFFAFFPNCGAWSQGEPRDAINFRFGKCVMC